MDGSVQVINTIKPANNNTFPVAEAPDILIGPDEQGDLKRLSDTSLAFYTQDGIPNTYVPARMITVDAYEALPLAEKMKPILYVLYKPSTSTTP